MSVYRTKGLLVMRRFALSILMFVAAQAYAHAEVCVENDTLLGERRFIATLVNGFSAASLLAAEIHRVPIGDYFCGGSDGQTPLYLGIYLKPKLGEPSNYDPSKITIYVSSKAYTIQPDNSFSVQVEQNPDGTPKVTAIDSDKPTVPIAVPMQPLDIPRVFTRR